MESEAVGRARMASKNQGVVISASGNACENGKRARDGRGEGAGGILAQASMARSGWRAGCCWR